MRRADPDTLASAAAVDFAHRLAPHLNAALGTELLAACLSLAHGGFSRRYSDIDVALVTESGLSPQAFLDQTRPAGLDVGLITRALKCRHVAAGPDPLFPVRTELPSQIDACAALLADRGAAV
jgi:hypothetical protein